MTRTRRQWMHNVLAIAAMGCSAASLVALMVAHATRWTTPLNVLAVVLIFMAMSTRSRPSGGDGADPPKSSMRRR